MKNSTLFDSIRDFAMNNSELDDIHGFPHVERVYNLCLKLANKLKANIKVLKIAALLHDIGRIKKNHDESKRNHAEISVDLAKNYLNSLNFNISEDELENILHCIKSHSYSNNITPRTIEAKILSDADKLDAIGAIGLYRTIGYTVKNEGNVFDVIHHLEDKIVRLKDQLFLDSSKKLAEERQKIILNFYKEIKNEAINKGD
jgi:uncharacterized protein